MAKTIAPLQIAMNEYMRTLAGLMPTTPRPLLHATTRLPLLQDKIKVDATMTIITSIANGTLLGKEYLEWAQNGQVGEGWSLYEAVRQTISRASPDTYTSIHPRQNIPENHLESLHRVEFKLSDRKTAIKKHKQKQLLPTDTEGNISIWTDGSFNQGSEQGGAAAILIEHQSDPTNKIPHSATTSSIIDLRHSEPEDDNASSILDLRYSEPDEDMVQLEKFQPDNSPTPINAQATSWGKIIPVRNWEMINPHHTTDQTYDSEEESTNYPSQSTMNKTFDEEFDPDAHAFALHEDQPTNTIHENMDIDKNTQYHQEDGNQSTSNTHNAEQPWYKDADPSSDRTQTETNHPLAHTNPTPDTEPEESKYPDPPHSTTILTKLQDITSSYETEILALQSALFLAQEKGIKHNKINIMSDSLSYLKQLQSLPIRPRYVNKVIADIVARIHDLSIHNTIVFIFVPSHINIGYSEVVDERAKQACKVGDDFEHDPLLSSYKQHLNRITKQNLNKYLLKEVKNSIPDTACPNRNPFKGSNLPDANTTERITRSPYEDPALPQATSLLNRTRTGHTRAKAHLYRKGRIAKDPTCRHCGIADETVEHQLIHCIQLENKLTRIREQYHDLNTTTFDQAIWNHTESMNSILKKALRQGVVI